AYGVRVAAGRYVSVTIEDQGVGIPREHIGRICDPYFTTKGRGSGLGLATTHSIVKNHGGFLAVDSQVGRGTTVRIDLPAFVQDGAAEQPPEPFTIEHVSTPHRAPAVKQPISIH